MDLSFLNNMKDGLCIVKSQDQKTTKNMTLAFVMIKLDLCIIMKKSKLLHDLFHTCAFSYNIRGIYGILALIAKTNYIF